MRVCAHGCQFCKKRLDVWKCFDGLNSSESSTHTCTALNFNQHKSYLILCGSAEPRSSVPSLRVSSCAPLLSYAKSAGHRNFSLKFFCFNVSGAGECVDSWMWCGSPCSAVLVVADSASPVCLAAAWVSPPAGPRVCSEPAAAGDNREKHHQLYVTYKIHLSGMGGA